MGKAASAYVRQRDMSVHQLMSEAKTKQARIDEKSNKELREQQALALGIPPELRGQNWNESITGCLIFMCEYKEAGNVDNLKNKYLQIHRDYIDLYNEAGVAWDALRQRGGSGGGVNYDEDSQEYIDKCERVKARWLALDAHLKRLQNSMRSRINKDAILNIMSDNSPPEQWRYHTHQFKQLRIVLDSIDAFLGGK